MRWYTSDLHFCHTNILRYQSNRKYSSVDEMDTALVHNWNSVVDRNDEVWVLGDLIMGRKRENIPRIIPQLNGEIHLVPGNHDGCWTGNKQREPWIDFYEKWGVSVERETVVYNISGHNVMLCHFPYDNIDSVEGRYEWARPIDEGLPLLHGHVHSLRHYTNNQFNVGVDVNRLFPVSEEVIEAWLNGGMS